MKKNILLLFLFFNLTSCQASSDKNDIDTFIKQDIRNYITDNHRLIVEANKEIRVEPALKEIIFKNTFVKLKTAESLLNDEYGNWLIGLKKNDLDFDELNSICWMVVYMDNYVKNMDNNYEKNIIEDTKKSVEKFYRMKGEIIKLRDSNKRESNSSDEKCR